MSASLSLSLGLRGREAGWWWALIRGCELIKFFCLQDGRLFEVDANSKLGAYSNKYGNQVYHLPFLQVSLKYFACFKHPSCSYYYDVAAIFDFMTEEDWGEKK